MAERGLEWFESALGAVSKINLTEGVGLEGARCPQCEASDFAKVSDLYAESLVRLEEQGGDDGTVRAAGMTDAQIVARLGPPRRTSALIVVLPVALSLAAIAFYLYRRFGETVGQISFIAALVVTTIVLMTTLRSFSDRYYHKRQRWNRLYKCRKCGQLIAS